jgi:hypothetical protein
MVGTGKKRARGTFTSSPAAAGEPVSVRAAGAVERMAKWARRNPTLAAAYALGLLTLLFGWLRGAAVWQWRAAAGAREVATTAKAAAELARDGEATARAAAEKARDGEAKAREVAEQLREKVARLDMGGPWKSATRSGGRPTSPPP